MRHSVEPKHRIYVKGYGFLSFAKNIGTHLSSKYGQKPLDSAQKKIKNRCNKNCFKKAIQKTAKATGDLISNKIADKITSVSKVFQRSTLKNYKIIKLMMKQKCQKKDTYLQKKGNKLLMN